MPLPNMIIFGARRCGSSALWSYLNQHPDIYMSPVRKELNHLVYAPTQDLSLDVYKDYFNTWSGEKIIGEGSINYIYFDHVPSLLAEHLPNVKLICILRHPVERAYSQYHWAVNRGYEWLSFADALAQESVRLNSINTDVDMNERLFRRDIYSYRDRGLYAKQIKHYLQWFDRRDIHVVIYEEWKQARHAELAKICEFLDIAPFEFSVISREKTSAYTNDYPMFPAMMRQLARIRFFMKDKTFKSSARIHRLVKNLQQNYPRRGAKPSIASHVERELLEYYRQPNEELAELLGRELPW